MAKLNSNHKPELTEAQLKRQVEDFLAFGVNQGRWYADRLNSGEFIEVRGKTRRRIKGCRKGTADFFVIRNSRTTFIETKRKQGRISPEQRAFRILVEIQGADYLIIRSLEELIEILK